MKFYVHDIYFEVSLLVHVTCCIHEPCSRYYLFYNLIYVPIKEKARNAASSLNTE